MKYAIIRKDNGELQAIFEAENNEPFSWSGSDAYEVIAAFDFDIDLQNYDYADYHWNKETNQFETNELTIQEREEKELEDKIAAVLEKQA